MMQFAICTSVYEQGRPFLDEWIDGVLRAARGRNCRVVVANDGLAEAEAALDRLSSELPVEIVAAERGANPAMVRQTMLKAGQETKADLLVFCDMDDWLLDDALSQHEAALGNADFSYGDLRLVNGAGTPSGATFLEDASVPDGITRSEQIADRNWLGFSNTAVRRQRLPEAALHIPDSVIAADWWFFAELVARGLQGRRTAAPVATYRMHSNNLVGPWPAATRDSVRRRAEAVRRHHAARTEDPVAGNRLPQVEALLRDLETPRPSLGGEIESACSGNGVWFEDIARLCRDLNRRAGQSTTVALPDYAPPRQFVTASSLADDLAQAGINHGDTLMAHVSLGSLGFIIGGTRAVLDALYEATGSDGTLMMAAFSGELTDPGTWFKPPVPREWWADIRSGMPPFDPARTPTTGVGVVAECFRTEPGVLRSSHPVSSFTARGRAATELLREHPLEERFGPASPIGRLCEVGGKVALVGAPFESLTALHLTNYHLGIGEPVQQRSPMLIDGEKQWFDYVDRSFSWTWFDACVRHLIDTGVAHVSRVGEARTIVMDAAAAVDAATEWRRRSGSRVAGSPGE